ncbi:RHTO0S30e00650g1_1 [Rhodotorula toruloides]|uniref:RHTO0S30e00650g1_1 n=1 Tax=Rhodotorula toruloides TaxID=5286 RepID=A0A061BRM2_RHOTO|nr:RHTO0S30e00650g1_1 [Rhodotorula toruloides]
MSDWDFRQVLHCNSTMKALIDANWQRHKLDMAYDAFISSYYCRETGNATLTREANRIWVAYNNWGYWPNNGWAMFTLVAFGLSALLHIYQILRSRYWSFVMVVMGCGGEMYGWSMRWIGGQNLLRGYGEQLAALTVSPIVFSGALYSLFGSLARSMNPSLLPIGSKKLTWWLFGVEFFTLLVQVGGGATAAGAEDASTFNVGSWIMLGGIVAQLVVTLIFLAVFGVYFSRLRSRHNVDIRYADSHLKVVFWGIIAISSLIVIRGAYRTAELSEGMFGPIAHSQAGLILGDCIPMLAVTYIFNVVHPLYTLQKRTDHVFNLEDNEEIKLGQV